MFSPTLNFTDEDYADADAFIGAEVDDGFAGFDQEFAEDGANVQVALSGAGDLSPVDGLGGDAGTEENGIGVSGGDAAVTQAGEEMEGAGALEKEKARGHDPGVKSMRASPTLSEYGFGRDEPMVIDIELDIKQEPVDDYESPFVSRGNTREDAIIIDDEDDSVSVTGINMAGPSASGLKSLNAKDGVAKPAQDTTNTIFEHHLFPDTDPMGIDALAIISQDHPTLDEELEPLFVEPDPPSQNLRTYQTNGHAEMSSALDMELDASVHDIQTSTDVQQPSHFMSYDVLMPGGPVHTPFSSQNPFPSTVLANGGPSNTDLDLGSSFLKTPAKLKMNAGLRGKTVSAGMRAKILQMQQNLKQKMSAKMPQGVFPSTVAEPAKAAVDAGIEQAEEEAHKEAAARFAQAKKEFELKKRMKKLSLADEIAFMKLQSAEDARLKKLQRDREREMEEAEEPADEQDTPLFEPEYVQADDDEESIAPLNPRKRARGAEGSEDESEGVEAMELDPGEGPSTRDRRKVDLPRQASRSGILRDAEFYSMRVALEADLDKPQKKKKGDATQVKNGEGKAKARAPKGKGAKGRKGKNTSNKAEKGGKKSRGKVKGPSLVDVGSLLTSDVFRDAAGHENGLDQPTFTKTVKNDALKQLIASVPEEFQKTAKKDKVALLAATKDFTGKGSVKPDGRGKWLVKGMKSSLTHYQLLGSAFMRRREGALQEPRGGLSADQMGLGKTVMMLANIINGKPAKSEQPRTTLIVASPALLIQWEREIRTHCEEKFVGSMMRYHATARLVSNRGIEILQSHDIVLTTYSEVMRSYPKNDPPIEMQTVREKQEWWKEEYEKNKGLLHRMVFYRVVLDEAQVIKNHLGRTSIACRGLMARHRWALSGTPILNTLTELYPYFKFLRVPHTGSFRIFKHNYCSSGDPDLSARLLIQLNQFMIRRTHKDEMFGGPILKLPRATPITHWCEFNDVERTVYDIVRHRFIERINLYAQTRQLEKCYYHVFVMLLRLRQLTGHILMLQLTMEDILEREDIERLHQVTNETTAGSESEQGRQIISIRRQLAALVKKQNEASEDGTERCFRSELSPEAGPSSAGPSTGGIDSENIEPKPDVVLDTGGAHGMTFNFHHYLKTMQEGKKWEEIKEKAQCGKCRETPKTPWITSCHHIYCKECMEELQLAAAEKEKDAASCLICGYTFNFAQACADPESPDMDCSQSELDNAPKKKGKKGQSARPDRDMISNDWIELNGSVLPSAKTLAIKAQILNWLAEDPNVKIIVYTQFLAMIRILTKICGQEGWSYCEYHGNMSLSSRDKSISAFTDDPEKSILLASLRCGGLGLNLMMASRVIIIDPWWNHAVEQQAFCRVFRYGQEQKTYMTRFCVKNTVDEKLIKMQEKKQAEIDDVMEDDGARLKKLTLKELMRLFGPIREEEDGTPFILVDDPVDNSGYSAGLDDEGFTNSP